MVVRTLNPDDILPMHILHPLHRRGHAPGILGILLSVGALLPGCGPSGDEADRGPGIPGEPSVPAEDSSSLSTSSGSMNSTEPTPDRLAFLVGIDRYQGGVAAGLGELGGCKNDIRRVRELLLRRFGFQGSEIHTLEDEQATLDTILVDFQRVLLDRAGENTEVVIWFSGHGSRVPDASGAGGAELDGLDSTLLAYDSRSSGHSGGRDLSDDALHSLLVALSERTSRVLVVTDACHSGTVLRSGGAGPGSPGVRAGRPGDEPVSAASLGSSWPAGIPFLDDHDRGAGTTPTYVHIAACGPGQQARELQVEGPDGTLGARGALSLYLTRGLERVSQRGTLRSWVEDAALGVSTRIPSQTVWVEGDLDRPLFGSLADGLPGDAPRGFALLAHGSGVLGLEGGVLQGLYPGLEMRVETEGGEVVGEIRLASVTALHSRAEWIAEDRPVPSSGSILRALAEGPLRDELPLEIAWGPDLPATDRRAAEGLLSSAVPGGSTAEGSAGDTGARPEPWIRWVGPEQARYLLARDPRGAWVLRDLEGPVLFRGRPGESLEEGISGLTSALESERTWRRLVRLPARSGDLRLPGVFRSPTEAELEAYAGYRDAGVRRVPGHGGFVVPGARLEDDALTFLDIANTTDRTLFVSVLSLAEDRGRHLLWPLGGRRDEARLAPGENVSVAVQVALPEAWTLERAMLDRYLVIATERYADFSSFESGAQILRGALGEELRGLPPVLRTALLGGLLRGGAGGTAGGGDWGVGYVDLRVDPGLR